MGVGRAEVVDAPSRGGPYLSINVMLLVVAGGGSVELVEASKNGVVVLPRVSCVSLASASVEEGCTEPVDASKRGAMGLLPVWRRITEPRLPGADAVVLVGP